MITEQIVRVETDGTETRAEVVGELIRCRNCKYFDMSDIGGTIPPIVYRCRRFARTYRYTEDYCSYAERKDGDGDDMGK